MKTSSNIREANSTLSIFMTRSVAIGLYTNPLTAATQSSGLRGIRFASPKFLTADASQESSESQVNASIFSGADGLGHAEAFQQE